MKHSTAKANNEELRALANCVQEFKTNVFNRLKEKYKKGYCGWDNPNWELESIENFLRVELSKKKLNPIDIAAYAMFLWNRE